MQQGCFFVFFCFLVCLVHGQVSSYTLQQRTNHFDPSDFDTFSQRYWVYEENYRTGGPILLYLNSFAIPILNLEQSAIYYWGTQLSALEVELEVRYSGQSVPTNFSTSELRYQTFEQNLADLVSFRVQFLDKFPQYISAQWIVIGEYFNGNYALWTREKYPNSFLGAVGVGSPVLAIKNFDEYFQFWANAAGPTCASGLHEGTIQTENELNNPDQNQQIKQMFGCTDMPDDTEFFYVLAQLNQFGIGSYRNTLCPAVTDVPSNETIVSSYAQAINQLLTLSGLGCNEWSLATTANVNSTYRPTFYLDCVSIGQFNTAPPDGPDVIVSQQLDVNWYLSMCRDVFGLNLDPNTVETNIVYGGKNMWGSNYAYISTTTDPYKALQVNQTSLSGSEFISVVTAESIFEFISGLDTTPNIQSGRDEVLNLMQNWLGIINTGSQSTSPAPNPSFSPSPSSSKRYSSGEMPQGDAFIIISIIIGFLCFVGLLIVIGLFVKERATQPSINN